MPVVSSSQVRLTDEIHFGLPLYWQLMALTRLDSFLSGLHRSQVRVSWSMNKRAGFRKEGVNRDWRGTRDVQGLLLSLFSPLDSFLTVLSLGLWPLQGSLWAI